MSDPIQTENMLRHQYYESFVKDLEHGKAANAQPSDSNRELSICERLFERIFGNWGGNARDQ